MEFSTALDHIAYGLIVTTMWNLVIHRPLMVPDPHRESGPRGEVTHPSRSFGRLGRIDLRDSRVPIILLGHLEAPPLQLMAARPTIEGLLGRGSARSGRSGGRGQGAADLPPPAIHHRSEERRVGTEGG